MESPLFTRLFWADALERVISTMAQFLLVIGGADGAGLLKVPLGTLVTLTLLGGVASLLKSIVAALKARTDTASLTVDTKEVLKS